MADKEKFSLKDHLFNPGKVDKISREILNVFPSFDKEIFQTEVVREFPLLELKDRINHITTCLHKHLPNHYPDAVEILIKSLPKPCNPDLGDDDFGDFIYAPYAHFVALYGCNREHLNFSLQSLEQITTRFSAEDAIRYFLNAFPNETLKTMTEWGHHSHYHVRRLASEGSRPKLPWCQNINISVEDPLPILDNLYKDTTRYVTRSVANHLNDISKTHPELVIARLKKWKREKGQHPKEMDFIIRHALRTLIKKGQSSALKLIGIEANPPVEITSFTIADPVKMGTHLQFEVELLAKGNTSILLDYIIFFKNKKGEMNGQKVFKLKQISMKKDQQINLSKKHLMREFMSTKTLYRGRQEFALQINGAISLRKFFHLQ